MESCYDTIVILDFGSQYTQLIARRIRELHVHSVILPASTSLQAIRNHAPKGLVFSGGPSSVRDVSPPAWSEELLQEGIPVLGICYGMQVVAHHLGGRVGQADRREFGRANLTVQDTSDLFRGIDAHHAFPVWMSHGDRIDRLPEGFVAIAKTDNSPIAAMKHVNGNQRFFCLQFHPEVAHTTNGTRILQNFVQGICECQASWTMGSYLDHAIGEIREKVGPKQVICGLSGGVDSAVAAAMTQRAIGKQLTCVFIDNGLLRKNEAAQIKEVFGSRDFNFVMVDAETNFLQALGRVTNPEKKRKIIGRQFIKEFDAQANKIGTVSFLVQGTLYPDVIESISHKGPSATIKTHHNVGGLPARMKLRLIEPLRELFKDEVRELGRELGLPNDMVQRHPFPGPGLAIRILGALSPERLTIVREADAIFIEELRQHEFYDKVWQAFAVLLPVQTVGVMGDQRTYENVIAIRAVTSVDGMTADWARLPHDMLAIISNRIINEVKGVNRVVYDVSSKPPSTIEWE